jgi:hypothetical protein
MARHLYRLAAVGIVSFLAVVTGWAQEDMVANPYYKFWAASKPGATATHIEHTKLSGPEGKLIPGGEDEKRITYKLLEVDDKHAIVQMVVTERDFLGYVQAAPTRYIYPAKVKKSYLERILLSEGGTVGEDTVKLAGKDGKEIKAKTLAGTIKEPGGEEVDFKLWLSDEVPGKIVKQVRSTRRKGETLAETTITLQSYKASE